MGWLIECSQDRTKLAEIIGNYKRGDIPPPEAYRILDGVVVRGAELACPHPRHKGRTKPIWRKIKNG